MLFLIVTWLCLFSISLTIGLAVLNALQADRIERRGDRAILSAWLGIAILANSLLFVSLLLPLSPAVGIAIASIGVAIALQRQDVRLELHSALQNFTWKWKFISLTLATLVALFASQIVTAYDTGLYHFQVIKWLSEFGAVPGLSLIFYTFGYPSSWLALAAPFNFGSLATKATTVTGGFAFFLLLLQFALSCDRLVRQKQQFSDWFLFISSCLCLPILVHLGLPNSPSPDVPIVGLSIAVPWTIILTARHKFTVENPQFFNIYLIPIILAAAALNIKLNAIILLFAAILFYSFAQGKNSLKPLLFGSAIALFFSLPMLGFGLKTSGCPLYPASVLCWDSLPWSVGAEIAQNSTKVIQTYSRWQTLNIPTAANSWDWLWPWMQRQKQTVFLIAISCLSLIPLYRSAIRGRTYLIILGVLGILLLMYGSPLLRVGLGYLYLLPALMLAIYCDRNVRGRAIALLVVAGAANLWLGISPTLIAVFVATTIFFFGFWFGRDRLTNRAFIPIVLLLGFAVTFKSDLSSRQYQFRPWLPPPLENLDGNTFVQKQVNDLRYLSPAIKTESPSLPGQDRCWSAALPCTPYLAHPDLKLRNPKQGIAAGFVRNSSRSRRR